MRTFGAQDKKNPVVRTVRSPNPLAFCSAGAAQQTQVRQILRSPGIQTKLTVGAPDDIHEQEADRLADQVMRMPEPSCPECIEGDEVVRTKEAGGQASEAPGGLETGLDAMRGSGMPLSGAERSFFEPRFGADFSRVRLHTGSAAEDLAGSVSARAFTVGAAIAFGAGEYAPATAEGQRLLAHELTHVVQQGEGEAPPDSIQCDNGEPSEEPEAPRATPERAPYRLEFNNPLVDPGGHASLYELGPAVLGFGLEKLAEKYPGLNRNFWYRLGEWSLLGVVPLVPYMVYSHEYGHYSIGEQFGWDPVPELTGFASGVTSSGVPPGITVTPAQSIAFSAGGVNQEEINARVMYTRWALRGNVRYQEAMAYLLAQTNLALYTARTLSLSNPPSKDDINNYVTRTGSLSTGQLLAVAALADLLSGPSWAALIGQYRFLRSGERRVEIPTFTLGSQTLTYPHFQMQLLSGGPVLGGRIFLNPAGRIPVEFTFDTSLSEPGIALGATFHAIPVLTPNLRISPFIRTTIADPVGIAVGVDVNYQIAPWIGISGRLGIRKNDLLREPALPGGLVEGGGALTLSF
ncbi:hypothetical protein GPROT1_01228 [Gammaproteobacteria bacterium]|nr:hypothetical protein GPROT1_01228 [Gammaproteobacteria bacterium]